MSVVAPRYQQLQPTLAYLSDPVVLAQAWKKTHTYIRSHNWYADTLELDASAFNLEKDLERLSEALRNGTYQPEPMRLVPAPKSDDWTFVQTESGGGWSWGSKCEKSFPKELRPLAHLSIQDQVAATALMLCLADAIETTQGSTNPSDKHKVASYGNRLYCTWVGKDATFRWGNTTTYSQYFQDYQRFLDRPSKVAEEYRILVNEQQVLYEIHLDISAFFDHIDRDQLLHDLRKAAESHYDLPEDGTEAFWECAANIMQGWQWDSEASHLVDCLKGDSLPNGLPQGLVASGFFANAYLLNFDQGMQKACGGQVGEGALLDYCRYVDDMRLLVIAPPGLEECLKKSVHAFVQDALPTGLDVHPDKTLVQRHVPPNSHVSARMRAIQSTASGPRDAAVLDSLLQSVEGLYALAELHKTEQESPFSSCDIGLSKVGAPTLDVRDETVLRFAANRWYRALRDKRALVPRYERKALDALQETVARRFIANWSRNPSMILLLKKAFSLYPNSELLELVWRALEGKVNCTDSALQREQRVAWYCMAEIFRFGAIDARRLKASDIPEETSLEGFTGALCERGAGLLGSETLPWYVKQQILLLLAVYSQPVASLIASDPACKQLGKLHQIQAGTSWFTSNQEEIGRTVPLLVVAWQLESKENSGFPERIALWLHTLFSTGHYQLCKQLLGTLAINAVDLFNAVVVLSGQVGATWGTLAKNISVALGHRVEDDQGQLSVDDCRALVEVITSPENPFAHENGLLVLARALLTDARDLFQKDEVSPMTLAVASSNWADILDPSRARLDVRYKPIQQDINYPDERFHIPGWVSKEGDGAALYRLGCILRSCAIGCSDFTASTFFVREDTTAAYFGLKTSWFKRRLGMMHSPEALGGDVAPMSSWITELLFHLLQWPGLEVHTQDDWPTNWTLDSVLQKVEERIGYQSELYGRASRLPLYIQRIKHPPCEPGKFKVIMAQSLMPSFSDISDADLELNDPDYRSRHKSHISTMARLIVDKLKAVRAVLSGAEEDKSLADLIIFPELAVHPQDIGELKTLADVTGAIIYAGLVFQQHNGQLINTAQWLIPWRNPSGRRWISRWQGKQHMTKEEQKLGIQPWRPYQLLIELEGTLPGKTRGFRLAGAICYDSTDIALASDLRDQSDAFIICALNRDINTFDNMVDALHYHMYQHVVLVNSGEFGGSVAQAPYKEMHKKQITHSHGNGQIAITMFDMDLHDFTVRDPDAPAGVAHGSQLKLKTPPAGRKVY